MKKGELKKQEFLRTAEIRFCRDGYEKTGVQDILDDLHTSKGSFYHHFVSKEALLEEICRNRAAGTSEKVFINLTREMKPDEKINALISGLIPFSGEKLGFLLMLIPVFSGPEGVVIRNCYANELENLYADAIAESIREGTAQGIFSCRDAGFSAKILIYLMNRFWLEVCDTVMENEKNGRNTDPSDLMALTGNYRMAAERILSAPFGSIQIMQLSDLQKLTEQIGSLQIPVHKVFRNRFKVKSAVREIPKLENYGIGILCFCCNCKNNIFGICDINDPDRLLLKRILNRIPKRIRDSAAKNTGPLHAYKGGCLKGNFAALRIGADQSAGSEKNSPEIADNNNTAIDGICVFQDIHHRETRSAAGFSVVTVAHDTRIQADNVCIAVMTGIAMLFFYTAEKRKRFLFGFTGRGISDKTAFLNNDFIRSFIPDGDIGICFRR